MDPNSVRFPADIVEFFETAFPGSGLVFIPIDVTAAAALKAVLTVDPFWAWPPPSLSVTPTLAPLFVRVRHRPGWRERR